MLSLQDQKPRPKAKCEAVRIWIDATDLQNQLRVFGMTLLERQLHTIIEADLTPTEVCIELPVESPQAPLLPQAVAQRLPLRWSQAAGSLPDRLARAVNEANGEPLLVLEANAVIDPRLLRYMGGHAGSYAAQGGAGAERTTVMRLEGHDLAAGSADVGLPELAQQSISQGTLPELALDTIPSYITKLRRDLPMYLFRVTDPAQRDRSERFLFWSNYKGSTDFFTKYVYPPLVWRLVRPLARWRVHPNVVTLFNVFITFAAVPLFARGSWLSGFLCAYTMSVLDSVDGKLARLTFRSSRLGDVLDHGLDIVHPPVWYAAWAWALSHGNMASPIFHASIWMTGVYILDRIVAGIFRKRMGRSIHAYTPLDERMRTFISRRNINTPLFMLGLLAGIPISVFYLIVIWQVATFLFHTQRLLHFWNDK